MRGQGLIFFGIIIVADGVLLLSGSKYSHFGKRTCLHRGKNCRGVQHITGKFTMG